MTTGRARLMPVAAVATITIGVIGIFLWRSHESPPAASVLDDAPDVPAFVGFPIFWLGTDYGGYRLDRFIKPRRDGWQQPAVLTYGNCGAEFATGCKPPIAIKTVPRCWPGLGIPDEGLQIRGRATSNSPNLTLETGAGTVIIYADKSIAMTIAQALTVANTSAFPQYAQIKAGNPLPGSLCELARLHPPVYPTPLTPESFTPEPHAATVIAALDSLGADALIHTYPEAEQRLRWKPLRNDDPLFTVAQEGAIGALRALKNPLVTFAQMYDMIDRTAPIMIRQEPESYPDFKRSHVTYEHLGDWDVEFYTDYGSAGAVFFSGASVDGQRIRVVVHAPRSDGFTLADIREFIRTLSTG